MTARNSDSHGGIGGHEIIECHQSHRRGIFATGQVEPWAVTLSSLRHVAPEIPVVVGTTLSETVKVFEQPGVEIRNAATPAALVNEIYRTEACHVLLITAPVVLPPCPLATALDVAASDLRCASVAFLSNAAAFVSFPHRDSPSIHQINGLDEVSITRKLRSHSEELAPCPLPYATGPAVLSPRKDCQLSAHSRTMALSPLSWRWPILLSREIPRHGRPARSLDFRTATA